jgi:hypothetical protein
LRSLADQAPSFTSSYTGIIHPSTASIFIAQSPPPHLQTFKRLLKTYLFDTPSLAV